MEQALTHIDCLIAAMKAPLIQAIFAPRSASRPSVAWLKRVAEHLTDDHAKMLVGNILAHEPGARLHLCFCADDDERLLHGMVWALSLRPASEAAGPLMTLITKCFAGREAGGIRDERLGNRCLWSLENLANAGGVPSLARLLTRTRLPKLRRAIDAALNRVAERTGIARDELDELAVPDHNLAGGERQVPVGGGAARIFVRTGSIELLWETANGVVVKTPPKELKAAQGPAVKAAQAIIKEIERDLATQKARLESIYLRHASWAEPTWQSRYADHGTMSVLARRLIWTASWEGRAVSLRPTPTGCEDVTGRPVDIDGARMSLWHPIESKASEVAVWRARLLDLDIPQPFRQAWRETYAPTDAERTTETYSNRFAGHILRQHQMLTLARLNGWSGAHRMAVDAPNDAPLHIRLSDFGLQAEYWTKGVGAEEELWLESGAYIYVQTDRVVFHRLDPSTASGRGPRIKVKDVPARVYSEIMRHCDLFTSVASINLDPQWLDRGPDAEHPNQWRRDADAYWRDSLTADLSATAKTRRQLLELLLPRMKKAGAFSLEENHLRVAGKLSTYRIHLGSAAVLLAPTNRHVCIVPASSKTLAVQLPFEGDATLSLIMSKALLLTDDDKISDPVIRRQIGG